MVDEGLGSGFNNGPAKCSSCGSYIENRDGFFICPECTPALDDKVKSELIERHDNFIKQQFVYGGVFVFVVLVILLGVVLYVNPEVFGR